MPGLAEFALGTIASLIANGISSLNINDLEFFQKRRVQRRIDAATAEVVEPLLTFLAQEGIDEHQQRLLFEAIVEELKPLSEDSSSLFEGSLNGQQIFENLYKSRTLPQSVTDEGLESVYSMLCPRVAALLCRLPIAVRDWESNAWAENFKRLDDVSAELKHLFHSLDAAENKELKAGDSILAMARKSLAQKVSMSLDLTGLRSDKPIEGKLDDFFVYPEIVEKVKEEAFREGVSASFPTWSVISNSEHTLTHFLYSQECAIVYGQPGAGKSTWTRWLQREALRTNWPGIALRIELRKIDTVNPPSFHDLFRQGISVHLGEEISAERVRVWTSNAKVIFILDGFDEIPREQRDPMLTWVKDLQIVADKCSIILTTRPLTTDHLTRLPKIFSEWSIQPFDVNRISEYIQRWYRNVPLRVDLAENVSPETLARQFIEDPTIEPLTSNPLLLSTLLMVHHLDGSLPNGRAELYKRYVDGMLGVWDSRRKVSSAGPSLNLREKNQILTDLAIHFQISQVEQIDESDAKGIIQKSLLKLHKSFMPIEVLDLLRERSGLLVGPGIYSFIHKSVGEYLLAAAIVQGTHRDAEGTRLDSLHLFSCRNDDRWRVVLFLWAGLAPVTDVLSFIERTIDSGDIELAYGILSDQYVRFPPEVIRGLALRIPQFKKLNTGVHRYICSGPIDFVAIDTPEFSMQGLRYRKHISSLFFRLGEDGVVGLKEFKKARGLFRKLLWVCLITGTPDGETWRYCAENPPSGIGPDLKTTNFIANTIAWRSSALDPNSTDFAKLFLNIKPKYGGMIALALLNSIGKMAFETTSAFFALGFAPTSSESLAEVVKLLTSGLPFDVPAEFLLGTEDWLITTIKHENVDLLKISSQQLEKLYRTNLIDLDSYTKSTAVADEFMTRRKKLAARTRLDPSD